MSPEQARGDVHNLDRRADIYSLGATLYDLILGVPPFEDQSIVNVLLKVLHEDPTPPRTILPSLPQNLETIILKCLSKEPAQRYDSALALAEDLQRHIKVEPILARRASLRYRLRRFVLRHRALVAVSTVSLLAILGLAGYSLRSRILTQRERARAAQRAAAQAQLAQQLAQDVKDIEWLLRSAYQLPLHDIGHEQDLTRRRMAEMEAQLRRLDPGDVGYIHYAIGRGHLALHELGPARTELLRARENGVDLPELHYALGAVLGQLYQKELIEARRHGDKGWLAARQKQLEVQYLRPALASLTRSHGAKLDSPELLASLVAWYRKQYDVALAKAKLTAVDSPWLYEARKLEGDVYLEQAIEQRGHGNYQNANAKLKLAINAYEAAANIGRSDASIYQAISEAWIQQSQIDSAQGKSPQVALQNALAACEKSNISAPQDATGYTKKSYTHFWLAWEKLVNGKDPRPEIEQLLSDGEQAIKLNSSDEVAYDAIGNGYWVRGNYERDIGQNPSESWKKAIHTLGQAIAVAPKFPWAVNDLGLVYQEQALWSVSKGLNPESDFKMAISAFLKAIDIHPEYLSAYNNLVLTYASFAQYRASHGHDVSPQLTEAVRAATSASAISKTIPNLQNNLALARLQMARFLTDARQDPGAYLAAAEKDLAASLEVNPNDDVNTFVHGTAMLISARYYVLHDKDPTPFIQKGQADVQRVVERNPGEADYQLLDCRLRLVEAQWARKQGRPATGPLRLALADALRAVSLAPNSAEALTELARVLLAQAIATSLRPPLSLLTEALTATDRALSIQNDLPQGHALRGALLLRQSEQLVRDDERQRLLHSAEESFALAFTQNPLLRNDYEADLKRIALLLRKTTEPIAGVWREGQPVHRKVPALDQGK
jgi:serine/threonine-protein kinase